MKIYERRKSKRNSTNDSPRLGSTSTQSQETRTNQDKIPNSNSTGGNPHSKTKPEPSRTNNLGGILSQLEQIRQSFVNANLERSKSRLAEDEENTKQVNAQIDQLKSEILELQKQNKSD